MRWLIRVLFCYVPIGTPLRGVQSLIPFSSYWVVDGDYKVWLQIIAEAMGKST